MKLTLLGSTGSIGTQAIDVAMHLGLTVEALSAHSNVKLLEGQLRQTGAHVCAVAEEKAAKDLKDRTRDLSVEILAGEKAAAELAARPGSDTLLNAIIGFSGMLPTLEAIESGKNIAIANKETLVAGGEIVMKLAEKNGVKIIPVDSEHSAIFQCLGFDMKAEFKKLIITASGGAFRDFTKAEIENKNAADALKHTNWQMGRKITIDCATMLNKGLEVIEACRLYNAPLEKVEAVVHPESIVHSMVEFKDGAIMAQLGFPSMEIPIQLALTYPERLEAGAPLMNLVGKTLRFDKIDEDRFPCFTLALEAFKKGGLSPCVMNAANEAAVKLYLDDKIKFYDIAELISYATGKISGGETDYDSLVAADREARAAVYEKCEVGY